MSLAQTCLSISHATWGPNSPRGGDTTAVLSQAANGNTFSRRKTIRPTIVDRYSLNHVTEVAREFIVRR
jgi:hypothetical protein